MENFSTGDYAVYPLHGVGEIVDIVTKNIDSHELKLFVINFKHNKMTIQLPVSRAQKLGLRRISSFAEIERAISIVENASSNRNTLSWSKRSQLYETKLNSGDLISIAEIIRDVRSNILNEAITVSYSERRLYQKACERLISEFAIIKEITFDEADKILKPILP